MKNSPRNILFKFFFRSFLITSRYKIQPAKNTKKAIGIYILNIILFVLSEVIINFYCLLRCRFSIATNGFALYFSLGFETMSTEILLTKLNV